MAETGIPERISRVETDLVNLHSDLNELKSIVKEGFREQNKQRGINYPLIGISLIVFGGLYGAFVRPLAQDTARQEKAGETLAQAVLIKDREIHELDKQVALVRQRMEEKITLK